MRCPIRPGIAAATRDGLAADFKALGIEPGDLVMLHASFKSLGPVAGGPDTGIDALMDSVGTQGSILMFVSWGDSPYEAFLEGGGLSQTERAAWPAFDPATASVRPGYAGAIGACLVRRPEAKRSANPDRSLAALGDKAKALIAEHPLDHGFGPGTPMARLVEGGGKSLLLGSPLYTVSAVHYAEYLCDVPDKQFVTYEVPLLREGRKVWCPVSQMNRDGFLRAAQGRPVDYIEEVTRGYLETRRHREGQIAEAQAYLFAAADYVDFAVGFLKRNFG